MFIIKYNISVKLLFSVWLIALVAFSSCKQQPSGDKKVAEIEVYQDTTFIQEFHEAFLIGKNTGENEVRSIAVDTESNVWIATAAGVFRKSSNSREWIPVITGEDRGPAYSVEIATNGTVFLET